MKTLYVSDEFFKKLQDACTKYGVQYSEDFEFTYFELINTLVRKFDDCWQDWWDECEKNKKLSKEFQEKEKHWKERILKVVEDAERILFFVSEAIRTESRTHRDRNIIASFISERITHFLTDFRFKATHEDDLF